MTPEELLKVKLTPNSSGDYFRIRLTKDTIGGAKTVYFRAMSVHKSGQFLCGFEIEKDTLNEKGCSIKQNKTTGKEEHHVTHHMIHCDCIEKLTPLFVDIRYGELTTLDIPEQKKKYGYTN
jgi:hypothetical protein